MKTELEKLTAPFPADKVKWKPAVINANRALAMAYVEAVTVQDRLTDVLGVVGWQDDYEFLADGSAVCKLKLYLGSEWICKMDVGGATKTADQASDLRKQALEDAFKRAAAKFGIGRCLYRLPTQWVDYDPQRRAFVKTPQLPEGFR